MWEEERPEGQRLEVAGQLGKAGGGGGTRRPAREMTPQAASTAESTVPSSPARGAVWWRLRDGRQNCLHPATSQRGRSLPRSHSRIPGSFSPQRHAVEGSRG